MIYLGRYQLGDWVRIPVRITNGSLVVTAPSATVDFAPGVTVFKSDGTLIESVKMMVTDKTATSTTFFEGEIRLGSSYTADTAYMVHVSWYLASGTYTGSELYSFQTVGGGNANGAIVSMIELDQPDASYVIQELDSGAIVQGRNPRL